MILNLVALFDFLLHLLLSNFRPSVYGVPRKT